MIEIRKTQEEDISFIVSCLDGKSEDFHHQCGYGRWHTVPVTAEQYKSVMETRIDNTRYFTIWNNDVRIGSVELDFIE